MTYKYSFLATFSILTVYTCLCRFCLDHLVKVIRSRLSRLSVSGINAENRKKAAKAERDCN